MSEYDTDDPRRTAMGWTMIDAAKVKYFKRGTGGQGGEWKPLTTKYNWSNFPRAMLRSRVISEGVRACYPGTGLVLLSTEEAMDVHFEPSVDVSEEPLTAERKSAYQARKDGDWDRLMESLSKMETRDEVYTWSDVNADAIYALPTKWQFELSEAMEKRIDAIEARDAVDREAERELDAHV